MNQKQDSEERKKICEIIRRTTKIASSFCKTSHFPKNP